MRLLRLAACVLLVSLDVTAQSQPQSAADIAAALHQLSLDPSRIYRVRDLNLSRGGVRIYLNEGILGFFQPIAGHTIAAIFTTAHTDLGDAELIVFPPQRSERASLSSFAKSPNLDEHLGSALFLFSDDTAKELTEQIDSRSVTNVPEADAGLSNANSVGRDIAGRLDIRLVQSLLDRHRPSDGLFFGVFSGRNLGIFDLMYDPTQSDSVLLGAVGPASVPPDKQHFQTWTNFRPRSAPPYAPPPVRTSDYRIEIDIHPDLSLAAAASFNFKPDASDGRALVFELSPHLKVSSGSIDGQPVEILQSSANRPSPLETTRLFLVSSVLPLEPDINHRVELHYSGSLIRKLPNNEYFVEDRNTWYPLTGTVFAKFDLIFHCPEFLHLVSTGELISETVSNGVRTIHRQTFVPEGLAGFNLGNYTLRRSERGPYQIDVYSENAADVSADPDLPARTAAVLADYTKQWIPLPFNSLAVTPIAGYFGQGFPGLIYLSNVSYMKQSNRPAGLRNPRFDAFFSDLLLPHEIAHQWWGNILRAADYRSAWIAEAMANDSALQEMRRTKGAEAQSNILDGFRQDLMLVKNGKTYEAAGPVDFGERLIDSHDLLTWHVITYEKGAWILEMLRQRLGGENFRSMQIRLLRDCAAKPITNEDFRRVLSSFVPAGQPDKSLSAFFDTWVYGTGIPHLALHKKGRLLELDVSGVEEDFIADVPLHCKGASAEKERWVRAGFGTNTVELPAGAASCELPSPRSFLYIQ